MELTDAELIRQIEACTLPKEAFTHRNHVRLGWLYLGTRVPVEAAERMAETIERYATSLGAARKFDKALTVAWMVVIDQARIVTPTDTFDAFIAAHPALLDRSLVTSTGTPASASQG